MSSRIIKIISFFAVALFLRLFQSLWVLCPLPDSTHVSYPLRFIRHQFRPPRSVFYNPAKTRALSHQCLAELRHRLSSLLARVSPPFHYGETLRSLLFLSLFSLLFPAIYSGKNQKTYTTPCPNQNQTLK